MKTYKNVDEYIANFPGNVQGTLEQIRQTVSKSAPKATEKISYGIPTFYLNGNLVHFAAYENHIGFYPGPKAIKEYKNELSANKTSKGTIQFPLDQPIPYDILQKITKTCTERSLEK